MYNNENLGDFADFKGWHGHRARRGNMKPIILRMLQKMPMHGYEIINQLEEKSHGMWRPSAGSIYPNLQLLEEQDLVTSSVEDGKKVYALTDQGKAAAEKAEEEFKAPWEEKAAHAKNFHELRITFLETMGVLRQIALQDSEEKNTEVKKILNETKEKLTKLVDEDTAS